MLLTPTITATAKTDPAIDQQQLYAQGLDGIRQLSRKQWTDHNVHDPGITTLELLCYALTELSYRARFAVEDLLATADDNAGAMAQQFFTPRQILPNRPLTTRDYRKLVIDLDGIKNAWIQPAAHRIYADTVVGELLAKDSGKPGVYPVNIGGLYSVLVEYMDDVTTKAQKQSIDKDILTALNANRNLCEVFTTVGEIGRQFYALCAELELETSADQIEVAAQIRFQVQRYLAPPVHCHSLATMMARAHADGTPYTVPEVFSGPALAHGFIDDAELDAAELRREIRLSDIISIIMDIPGVRAVRDIVVNALIQNKVGEWDAVEAPDKWRQQVADGMQPSLSDEVGRLVFYKRNVPVVADAAKVAARIQMLEDEETAALETVNEEDLPIPLGKARDAARYQSFQHHFPTVYGISAQGLSSRDPYRKALALQLKGYLLFFDQIMANFFAQLAQLRSLYAHDYAAAYAIDPEAARTFFAQRVDSIPEFARIYGVGTDTGTLQAMIEDADVALQRRNTILDHLLARLGEEFHDYVAVAHTAFGDRAAADALAKANFIADYPKLGAERSLAYNWTLKDDASLWNSFNVSGLERRICRLLDISNFSRRNLGTVSYDTYTEIDTTPGDEYRFRVKHPLSNKILLSSSTNYATPEAAHAEMELAITLAQQPAAYQRKITVDGKHYFNIISGSDVIARRIEYFITEDEMEAAISLLIAHLREYYSGEGMYLIESILLLPEEEDDPFLDICTDPSCTDCSQDQDNDPYSYRLNFILPAYAGRFQNMDFRRFVEETIRQETPAHILPKVCWIDSDDMAALEGPYRNWIDLRAGKTTADRAEKIQLLITALQSVKNIYPQRLLYDCSADESKPPFILGRSALGSEAPEKE